MTEDEYVEAAKTIIEDHRLTITDPSDVDDLIESLRNLEYEYSQSQDS